jgi:crotonobetainyl-CoA:carnitine CoA-transferase CaiB-like acyl-CoA transferase
MDAQPPTPLKGVKVVDLTHAWAGPTCTTMLGDLGADVVKIEPFSGDSFRIAADGALFVNINRNKRGICVDLKKAEGLEIVLRLLRKADVLVENFLPGTVERLGLGYKEVSRFNPGIIYCSISGYGQEGPFRDRPGYDPVAQAMSGIMEAQGEPGGAPVRILPATIDYCAGINVAFGIVCSLLERQKTGKGQRIDVSLLDVALNQMSPYVTAYSRTGELPQKMGSGHTAWAPYEAFPARDGLVLIAVITDQMWQNLCKALDLKEMADDPRYASIPLRRQNREELVKALRKITPQYESRDLEARLLARDVPCAKIRNVGEIVEEPHVKMRRILEDVDYPKMGKIKTVKSPIFFFGEPPQTRRQAPLLGEHTKEVLRELGYQDEGIEDLISKKIVLYHRS